MAIPTAPRVPRNPNAHHASRRRPHGSVLIWVLIGFAVLVGFCSLAVDGGRVYLTKSQLQHAADAAARHAAGGLAAGPATARARAADAADDNTADGTPVALDTAVDVEFGTWDAVDKTFTVLAGAAEASANAVRVTARRTAARGNPLRLAFAGLVGKPTFDLEARGIARLNSRPPGVVGLDFVKLGGTSGLYPEADSYRSASGGTAATGRARVYSNGNITVSGNARVNGDARPGPGMYTTVSGGGVVTGSTAPLPKLMDYPMESAGTYATSNDNGNIPAAYLDFKRNMLVSSDLTLPGGTYYLNNLTIANSRTLSFTGRTTLYLTDSLKIDGSLNAAGGLPANLRVVLVTAGTTAQITSSATAQADVYAPGSAYTGGGGSRLYGSLIAKSIDCGGSSRIMFDESMGGTAGVNLVR